MGKKFVAFSEYPNFNWSTLEPFSQVMFDDRGAEMELDAEVTQINGW